MTNPIRPTDDEARALARRLMTEARFAALAVIDETGHPLVTRVAFGLSPTGLPLTLVSELSQHTRALTANPACSLLVGEPEKKGDPLTHPRLSIQANARFVGHADTAYEELAAHYLRDHPKAKLYIGFADFHFVLFTPVRAFLNGGFGRAFVLEPADLDL